LLNAAVAKQPLLQNSTVDKQPLLQNSRPLFFFLSVFDKVTP
jgi:hypothetical protein